MSREKRIAENESFFRDLNKTQGRLAQGWPSGGRFSMRVLADRLRRPHTTVQSGNGKRSARERSASLSCLGTQPLDVEPGVEVVVKEYEHFWIVEKRGEAGEVAAKRE